MMSLFHTRSKRLLPIGSSYMLNGRIFFPKSFFLFLIRQLSKVRFPPPQSICRKSPGVIYEFGSQIRSYPNSYYQNILYTFETKASLSINPTMGEKGAMTVVVHYL